MAYDRTEHYRFWINFYFKINYAQLTACQMNPIKDKKNLTNFFLILTISVAT